MYKLNGHKRDALNLSVLAHTIDEVNPDPSIFMQITFQQRRNIHNAKKYKTSFIEVCLGCKKIRLSRLFVVIAFRFVTPFFFLRS